jgi:hypothetical protein
LFFTRNLTMTFYQAQIIQAQAKAASAEVASAQKSSTLKGFTSFTDSERIAEEKRAAFEIAVLESKANACFPLKEPTLVETPKMWVARVLLLSDISIVGLTLTFIFTPTQKGACPGGYKVGFCRVGRSCGQLQRHQRCCGCGGSHGGYECQHSDQSCSGCINQVRRWQRRQQRRGGSPLFVR